MVFKLELNNFYLLAKQKNNTFMREVNTGRDLLTINNLKTLSKSHIKD